MPGEDVEVFQEAGDFRKSATLEGGALGLARESVTPPLVRYDKEARCGGRGQEHIVESQQSRVDRRGMLHFEHRIHALSCLLQPDNVHFTCEGRSHLKFGRKPFDKMELRGQRPVESLDIVARDVDSEPIGMTNRAEQGLHLTVA